jgi:hypothetical protein
MKEKLHFILALPGRLERTAGVVWWIQSLYPDENGRPVLVGGAAMELLAEGAYLTDDMDLVGSVPPLVADKLRQSGFIQLEDQWLYEEESISFVFHHDTLRKEETVVERVFGGHRILMVSPEDLLVDRLAAWQHRGYPTHGVQAYLLYYFTHGPMDLEHLRKRAMQEDVLPALDSVIRLFFRSKGQLPRAQELGEWAGRKI